MNYDKIKDEQKRRGSNIQALCDAVGISQTGFHKMVRMESMQVKTLEKIADYQNKPISYYFTPSNDIEDPREYFYKNIDYKEENEQLKKDLLNLQSKYIELLEKLNK